MKTSNISQNHHQFLDRHNSDSAGMTLNQNTIGASDRPRDCELFRPYKQAMVMPREFGKCDVNGYVNHALLSDMWGRSKM
jgi:hypothetical protein